MGVLEKKIKTGGDGQTEGGCLLKRGFKLSAHYGLRFCLSILYIYFRWTQFILPITFGYKLFPFSHYMAWYWWGHIVMGWCNRFFTLLLSVKTFIVQFCQWPVDFLEVWEEQHTYTYSQIHYTISGIVPVTTSKELWDHIFTRIQMETKFTFRLCWDKYHHHDLGRIRFLI